MFNKHYGMDVMGNLASVTKCDVSIIDTAQKQNWAENMAAQAKAQKMGTSVNIDPMLSDDGVQAGGKAEYDESYMGSDK